MKYAFEYAECWNVPSNRKVIKVYKLPFKIEEVQFKYE